MKNTNPWEKHILVRFWGGEVGKREVLKAEEVTESGVYWWREDSDEPWRTMEVHCPKYREPHFGGSTLYNGCGLFGEFVGPLTPPED